MPLIVNRRKFGVPVRLKNGKSITLSPNQTVEVSKDDLSSFGVSSALAAHHIAVLDAGSPVKTSIKTENAEAEKMEAEKTEAGKAEAGTTEFGNAEAGKAEFGKTEAGISSNVEKSKKSKEGKAS